MDLFTFGVVLVAAGSIGTIVCGLIVLRRREKWKALQLAAMSAGESGAVLSSTSD
jgi:hypothetical protein